MSIRVKLTMLLAGFSTVVIVAGTAVSLYYLRQTFLQRAGEELRGRAEQVTMLLDRLPPDSSSLQIARQFIDHSGISCVVYDAGNNVLFDRGRPDLESAADGISTSGDRLRFSIHPQSDTGGYGIIKNGCQIVVEMPISNVNSTIAEIQTRAVLAGCALVVVIIGLTGIVAARLTAPISEMATSAKEIHEGALDRRIPVRGNDEFAQLALTLNAMVDRLNDDIVRLKKLEEIRSQFLGNVSHELRTPLFALQGMLETLRDGAIDDKEVNRDFVERALANTMRLDALLRDLIEISRIESGEMKMSFRYFPLTPFLGEIVDELIPLAEQRGLRLALVTGAGDVDVYGDRFWLRQAIVNMLENALKYTNEGSVTLTTSPGQMPLMVGGHGRKSVLIAIADTGVGIPEEHLPRIFERFYRVDRERSREAGGTGLGLAIVKHIVEAHGGTVDVVSNPGQGSIFSFRLHC